MQELVDSIPRIDWVLAAAVAVAGLCAAVTRRRGGRFRGLLGWSGFWVVFGLLLILLSRAPRWASFPLLGLLMFVSTRAYFFLAPVRPRDRFVILASYLAIPFALWFPYTGDADTFVATVPVALFLLLPVFISLARAEEGLLDSMGRAMLGVLFFVFCLAHLGLLVHQEQSGILELFGKGVPYRR